MCDRELASLALVDLVSSLGGHAARHHVIEDIGDAVDDPRAVAEAAIDDGQDVANARQHLQAVAAPNQTDVPRVWAKAVAVHDSLTRGRDGETVAAEHLEAQAALRARPLAALAGLAAAASVAADVSLAADVVVHVVVEDLLAQLELRAWSADHGALAAEPHGLLAGGLHHGHRELIGVVIARVSVDVVAGAEEAAHHS